MVDEQAVCILLECILVNICIFPVCNSSCGKVMFSQVSVCPQGVCVRGEGRVCVTKGVCGEGACMAKGVHGEGGHV